MPHAKLPFVAVWWVDAHTKGGWGSHASYLKHHEDPSLHVSVGLLLKRDAQALTVIQSAMLAGDGALADSLSDSITIPAACVRRVRRLRGAP